MKLVFLTSLVPVQNPKSGYDIANRVVVDGLKALGIQLKIIGYLTPGEVPAYPDDTIVLDELEVTNSKVGKFQKLKWLSRALSTGTPVSVAKMLQTSSDDLSSALDTCRPFDGLFLNSVQLPGAFLNEFRKEKFVFLAHNVESESAFKNALNAANIVSSILFKREAKLLRNLENQLCSSAEHVFTLANGDRKGLGIENKSTHLPLVTTFDPMPQLSSVKPSFDLGMIGSWSWAANRSGLDWFLSEVAPKLSDMKIAVAGNISNIPSDAPENVEFLGRVEDAHEFVNSCQIIPLISREGTGVQLKTIETFEMGLPTVATRSSLRGLDQLPENCVVADEPIEFANALRDMMKRVQAGETLKIDGKDFHKQQRKQLLTSLELGLNSFQQVQKELQAS